MRNRLMTSALAIGLALLLIVPAGTSQSLNNPKTPTATTLYFHIFDIFNVFPINTQAPNATFFRVGGTNFPTIASQGYDFNTVRGFSSAGPVEYDFIENGQPRFHPERGIAANVNIVNDPTNYPVNAFMYISVRDFLGRDNSVNVIPYFNMRVTVREGNTVGPDSDLDAGNLIMQGQTRAHLSRTPADSTVGGQQTPGDNTPVLTPDEQGVIEVAIPMTLSQDVIPKSNAYNVRVDWWQDSTGQADDEFSEGFLRLVSNADHPNRIEMAITNPVYIDFIHPQVAAGILLIHTAMNSPWGTYDVDVKNIEIEILDANGNPVDAGLERVISQNSHVHDLHDKSAEVTWLWRFRDEGAKDGKYTIKLSVPNNACATSSNPDACAIAKGEAGFILEGKNAYGVDQGGQKVEVVKTEEGKKSPAAGLLFGVVILALAAIVRRRF